MRRAGEMTELAEEQAHLAKADRDIVAGEERVDAQMRLITRLDRHRHDTSQAELLLANLQETLAAWRAHRTEILRTIARLENHPPRLTTGARARPAASLGTAYGRF